MDSNMEFNPVLDEVQAERDRQDARWGEQNHPDGTGESALSYVLNTDDDLPRMLSRSRYRNACNEQFKSTDWAGVLTEEVLEALVETDPACLRVELIQIAAVAVAWCEAIDRRKAAGAAAEVEGKKDGTNG